MMKNFPSILIMLLLALVSCNKDEKDPIVFTFETDFNKIAVSSGTSVESDGILKNDGWNAIFAEYPEGEDVFYELTSGLANLPGPLDQTRKAFMLSGNNHSDALQMFLVKQLSGLMPNTSYAVENQVELASKYPEGSVGIGGSPGNAVHLVSKFSRNGYSLEKSKGSNIQFVISKAENIPESYLDLELGDVSIKSEEYVYQLISRSVSSGTSVVKTDNNGRLWAVIGTWSGFEGITSLYYTKIKITLTHK